jgi:predicted transcriptional regulator
MNYDNPSDDRIRVLRVIHRMTHRSQLTIASNVLRVAQSGNATKTKLMYDTFLPFHQIDEYLAFLQKNALIVKSEMDNTYALTEKGVRFLQLLEVADKSIPLNEAILSAFDKDR